MDASQIIFKQSSFVFKLPRTSIGTVKVTTVKVTTGDDCIPVFNDVVSNTLHNLRSDHPFIFTLTRLNSPYISVIEEVLSFQDMLITSQPNFDNAIKSLDAFNAGYDNTKLYYLLVERMFLLSTFMTCQPPYSNFLIASELVQMVPQMMSADRALCVLGPNKVFPDGHIRTRKLQTSFAQILYRSFKKRYKLTSRTIDTQSSVVTAPLEAHAMEPSTMPMLITEFVFSDERAFSASPVLAAEPYDLITLDLLVDKKDGKSSNESMQVSRYATAINIFQQAIGARTTLIMKLAGLSCQVIHDFIAVLQTFFHRTKICYSKYTFKTVRPIMYIVCESLTDRKLFEHTRAIQQAYGSSIVSLLEGGSNPALQQVSDRVMMEKRKPYDAILRYFQLVREGHSIHKLNKQILVEQVRRNRKACAEMWPTL